MVNTPDHKPVAANVPVGALCLLDDVDEHTILTATATDDSYTIRMSASNSSLSFDTPPDTLPPVPPRIMKHKKHSLLDTSLTSSIAPSPMSAFTQSFENNFVGRPPKNTSQSIAAMRTSPPLLLPPPLKNIAVANSVSAGTEVCPCDHCLCHCIVLCCLYISLLCVIVSKLCRLLAITTVSIHFNFLF